MRWDTLTGMASPAAALGYSEEDGVVTLRMTRDDYTWVLFALGALAGQPEATLTVASITNRINVGNPNFKPYAVEPEPVRHCSVRAADSTVDAGT